jgi:hypothetical protein
MSAPALAPIPGICRICGCSEFEPCISAGGETCAWANAEHTLCDFCDELSEDMHQALDEGLGDDEGPLVIPATEAECHRYIREMRGLHA